MQTELIIVSEYCHKCQMMSPRLLICCKKKGWLKSDRRRWTLSACVATSEVETLQPDVLRFIYQHGRYRCYPSSSGENGGMRREMNSLRNQLLVYRKHELEETEWWKETGRRNEITCLIWKMPGLLMRPGILWLDNIGLPLISVVNQIVFIEFTDKVDMLFYFTFGITDKYLQMMYRTVLRF